jgi:hypothetical protein
MNIFKWPITFLFPLIPLIFMNVCVVLLLPRYGDHLLLRDFGLYGCYYNRYHGNAIKGEIL